MEKALTNPSRIAKWFINRADREAGDAITHLKLQKLIYYAQAWYLANYNRPLFEEDMQAWTHGPVVPSVWREYRDMGWEGLPPVNNFNMADKELNEFLEMVYSEYGAYSAKKLEHLTHEEEPWQKTRDGLPLEAKCTKPIDKVLIRDYYASRIGKNWIDPT